MSKELNPTEFKVTTKEESILYQGFEIVMFVKSFSRIDAQNQYERKGIDEWKCKFYKPIQKSLSS